MSSGPSPSKPPKRWSGMADKRPGGRYYFRSRPNTAPRNSEYFDTQRKDIEPKDS